MKATQRLGTACRFCGSRQLQTFADLGVSPLANSYLTPEQLSSMEPFYPLHARVCERCLLVQLEEWQGPEAIFSDYAYFSSYSDSWLDHARQYTAMIVERLGLDGGSLVVEVASNDGYLLQYFAQRGISVLGIDPAVNVAQAAEAKGIPTEVRFFGESFARELALAGKQADLLIGNNILAHVPDLNDFVRGLKTLLKPDGWITLEFPHLMRLVEQCQFDTVYHEHFSYFSFITVGQVFQTHGLRVCDVEEPDTHGGSLRIYVRHDDAPETRVSERVEDLARREREAGCDTLGYYHGFARRVQTVKCEFLEFMVDAKRSGRVVTGYGAPAKGNTFLNYCGVGKDFIEFTVDRSPHKQGRFLPGTRIPIVSPDRLREVQPDYVLILPWNLQQEIMAGHSYIREWGGKFVVAIPQLVIHQ